MQKNSLTTAGQAHLDKSGANPLLPVFYQQLLDIP